METLKHDDFEKNYPGVIRQMKETYDNVQGVIVEIEIVNDLIKLNYGSNCLYLTSDQTVDLMRELRRAVLKVDPKSLRKK